MFLAIEERLLCAQVNNEQNSPPSPNKAMSQANVADKSYKTTDQTLGAAAVDASEGDNHANHEKGCNSMDGMYYPEVLKLFNH